MTKAFVFPYADEREMLAFVDANWDRVSSVSHHDDFDGHYWQVLVLPSEKKDRTPDISNISGRNG